MAAPHYWPYLVAGGDESSGSDEDGWDIGVVQCEPQAGPSRSLSRRLRDGQLDQMLTEDKNEALKKALFNGEVSVVEELLNSGVSVESSLAFGWTPLMCAARLAHLAVVRLLLDRGANVCFEKDQYTVLMAACTSQASEENILKTVELLLSRNADPNATCRRQMTPLMYAARKGYPQVVALLVAHGSHVNAQDEYGYSALMWAAQHGHKSVVLKLLELGADKNLQAKDKKTAAELAKISKHLEIHCLLSLAENHLQGRHQETPNQEAIYKFLTAAPDCQVGSYSTFGDMEVFLHGLGLEHLTGLLKEKEITLRKLVIMKKDELTEVGIKDPGDQQKLLGAIKEIQVEELRIEELSEVLKVELSADEFLKFLQKLNKECSKLIIPVQTVNEHLLQNSHKVVLQWAPPERFTEVCEALVCSVGKLGEEVTKMKGLLEKHQQSDDPTRVKLPEKSSALEKRVLKTGGVILLGLGLSFLTTKLMAKKTWL